jgi:hypothetical protein
MLTGQDFTDDWFDRFVEGQIGNFPMHCPFLLYGFDWIRCQIERSSINIDLFIEDKTTSNGKPVKCLCLQNSTKGFKECKTFKESYALYKANPTEFKALMTVLAGKAIHECDKRRVGKL